MIVRPDARETVEDLIYTMFERRHHRLVAGPEQQWLTVELIQSLRQASPLYRDKLSSETAGPIPFALGYFRLQDGRLELTSDQVPANVEPEIFVRFLSDFVEPGARLWFGPDGEETGWEIRGRDNLRALEEESPS